MEIVGIAKAKSQLRKLVEKAARGEPFIIAKNGKPLVKVTGLSTPSAWVHRLGFMAGQILVPDDFDRTAQGPSTSCSGLVQRVLLVTVRSTDRKL